MSAENIEQNPRTTKILNGAAVALEATGGVTFIVGGLGNSLPAAGAGLAIAALGYGSMRLAERAEERRQGVQINAGLDDGQRGKFTQPIKTR